MATDYELPKWARTGNGSISDAYGRRADIYLYRPGFIVASLRVPSPDDNGLVESMKVIGPLWGEGDREQIVVTAEVFELGVEKPSQLIRVKYQGDNPTRRIILYQPFQNQSALIFEDSRLPGMQPFADTPQQLDVERTIQEFFRQLGREDLVTVPRLFAASQ